jgi:hypothetical protein
LDAGENQMKDPQQPGRGDEGSSSESLCSTISLELLLLLLLLLAAFRILGVGSFFPPELPEIAMATWTHIQSM